jgi:hypothetical protein
MCAGLPSIPADAALILVIPSTTGSDAAYAAYGYSPSRQELGAARPARTPPPRAMHLYPEESFSFCFATAG